MIFKIKKHNSFLYNTLLNLSRNIFFYKNLNFNDSYETRIYLMFLHYSIILFIQKARKNKPDQDNYNDLFFNIENNLRELGFGDVAVNKKMKELNKVFYDILLKFNKSKNELHLEEKLVLKYFPVLGGSNNEKYKLLTKYFFDFYHFCFEQSPRTMIKDLLKFKG